MSEKVKKGYPWNAPIGLKYQMEQMEKDRENYMHHCETHGTQWVGREHSICPTCARNKEFNEWQNTPNFPSPMFKMFRKGRNYKYDHETGEITEE